MTLSHLQGQCLRQAFRCDFCPRDAVFARYLLSSRVRLSVCLSVTSEPELYQNGCRITHNTRNKTTQLLKVLLGLYIHAICLRCSYNSRTTFQLIESVARVSRRQLSYLSFIYDLPVCYIGLGSACLTVCLSARLSQKLHLNFTIFLYMLAVAVARFSTVYSAIRYVLPFVTDVRAQHQRRVCRRQGQQSITTIQQNIALPRYVPMSAIVDSIIHPGFVDDVMFSHKQ